MGKSQDSRGATLEVTVAILAQGTHWAVAAEQAFYFQFESQQSCSACADLLSWLFVWFLVQLASFGQVLWYKRVSLHGLLFQQLFLCILASFGQVFWYKRASCHDLQACCFSTCFYWFWRCSDKFCDIYRYLALMCESAVSGPVSIDSGVVRASSAISWVSCRDLHVWCFSSSFYCFWRCSDEFRDIRAYLWVCCSGLVRAKSVI